MKKIKIFNNHVSNYIFALSPNNGTVCLRKISNISSYDEICDIFEHNIEVFIDENDVLFDISKDNWKQDLKNIILLKDIIE